MLSMCIRSYSFVSLTIYMLSCKVCLHSKPIGTNKVLVSRRNARKGQRISRSIAQHTQLTRLKIIQFLTASKHNKLRGSEGSMVKIFYHCKGVKLNKWYASWCKVQVTILQSCKISKLPGKLSFIERKPCAYPKIWKT